MRVFHFILGKANKNRANGVNQVIAGLAKYSAKFGAQVKVIGKSETVEFEGHVIENDGFNVEVYSKWSLLLKTSIEQAILWADIVHLHGVYSPLNLLVAGMCKKSGRPYLVTLHDGLAPERAIAKSRLKKFIFHSLFQRKYLENAAGVHVLTPEESSDLLSVSQPNEIFCIPNGIDIEDYPRTTNSVRKLSNKITIGYLGRLSKEKNLEALCEAFSIINTHKDFELLLAGPESEYGKNLLKRFSKCGVEWVGPKFGTDKTNFISSTDLFVHPSLCDVFSIAAMEVLALGTPLLITRSSKASYFYNKNAFFMCEPTVFGLEKGLQNALNHRDNWPLMVANGRRLIDEQLNWSAVANEMMKAYHQIVAGA